MESNVLFSLVSVIRKVSFISLITIFTSTANAGLIEGRFTGIVNSVNDIGLMDNFQNEYYNGESLFDGNVHVGTKVHGTFSYYSEQVADDISPDDDTTGNYYGGGKIWLSLSFNIGSYRFDTHNPYYQDILPETAFYQDGLYIKDAGQSAGDYLFMQKQYNTETAIYDYDATTDGYPEIGRVYKNLSTTVSAGVLNGDFLTSIDPFQNASLLIDEDSHANALFNTTESYYNLKSGAYDYYRGAAIQMDINQLSFGFESVQVSEPKTISLFLLLLVSLIISPRKLIH